MTVQFSTQLDGVITKLLVKTTKLCQYHIDPDPRYQQTLFYTMSKLSGLLIYICNSCTAHFILCSWQTYQITPIISADCCSRMTQKAKISSMYNVYQTANTQTRDSALLWMYQFWPTEFGKNKTIRLHVQSSQNLQNHAQDQAQIQFFFFLKKVTMYKV